MGGLRSLFQALGRKKTIASGQTTQLARVLTTLDLTALGIGSTLGVGIYVLAGQVSREKAGPAVVLSFLIAAVASAIAGLCYAEFGARVPKAGSAYVYSFVCVGEFIAFIIGWNLVLEYVIGAASVARGLSSYLDYVLDEVMAKAFRKAMPIDIEYLSEYPDFFAFSATMLFAIGLAFGAKKSSNVNNIFTIMNVAVVLYVIITGAFKADPANWNIPAEDVPEGAGKGGFMPFGIKGVIEGAATCFYGFVGFDCIATTGEEARNPSKSIPLAIVISLSVIFLSYFGVSSVLTLAWPYYAQDTSAPLPHMFAQVGWPVAKWIVNIGALFGLLASLTGALFPLPRIIYAMSSDGMIFRFLGVINPRFQTPVVGTLLAGLLTGIMAMLFDLKHLVEMMSIGTLMAYSIVAACVMLLRYEEDEEAEFFLKEDLDRPATVKNVFLQIFNVRRLKRPTNLSARIVKWEVLIYFFLCAAATGLIVHAEDNLARAEGLAIAGLTIFGVLLVTILVSIGLQATSSKELSFKVPLVPLLPGISIFANVYLMMVLKSDTWLRFLVWMVIGFIIYFGYGIRNSSQRKVDPKHAPIKGEDNVAYDDISPVSSTMIVT